MPGMLAFLYQFGQNRFHALQIGHFFPYFFQPCIGKLAYPAAVGAIVQLQQRRDIVQRESEVLLTDLKLVEEYYATQALDLTIGLGYIERPLTNTQIEKYLATIVLRALHPDEQITEFFHLFPFEVGHRLAGAEIRVNWFRARIECGAPILARLA